MLFSAVLLMLLAVTPTTADRSLRMSSRPQGVAVAGQLWALVSHSRAPIRRAAWRRSASTA